MNKKIKSALISVFSKDGLEAILQTLNSQGVEIYSTGGTADYIKTLNIPVIPVEILTGFPSILGGRLKTLHPRVLGGLLGIRNNEMHAGEMRIHNIPEIDLVITNLYPFEETVTSGATPEEIIEKIDIGGSTMIRAGAKNFNDVTVIASKSDYPILEQLLVEQSGEITLEQRRLFAAKAFAVSAHYEKQVSVYFEKSY